MDNSKHNTDTFSGPSFSFSNRFMRAVWNFVYFFFFRPSPIIFHGWRTGLLRLFGARIGRGVHISSSVSIWAPWNIVLGDQCGIGSGAILYSQDKIILGNKVVISQGAFLCTGTHDYTHPGMRLVCRPITIGSNGWIAAGAFIHPGVKIGEGCVIGARSVVIENMPSWMVCAGHPCKPLKKRDFNDPSTSK